MAIRYMVDYLGDCEIATLSKEEYSKVISKMIRLLNKHQRPTEKDKERADSISTIMKESRARANGKNIRPSEKQGKKWR